jgi:xanthine dehydrogenase accessory factor
MQSQACTRRYIVVGSKNSVQTAFNTLIKEGVCEDRLKRVYSPIGLDIGSEIVREIATG